MSASITPTELRAWADKRGTLQDDRTFFLAAADALEAAERRVAELIRLCEAADGERDAALDTLAALQVEKP